MGSNFMDEIDWFDFPSAEDGGLFENVGGCADFPVTWEDELPNPGAFLSKNAASAADDLSAELYVPYEDIVQLEWLSTFVEDSYSGAAAAVGKESLSPNINGESSPAYVLESSSSSSNSTISSSSTGGGDTVPLSGPQRARTKRPRPATFSPRPPPPATLLVESDAPQLSGQENTNKKKKKKKKKVEEDEEGRSRSAEAERTAGGAPPAVRRCAHCEITKTPQWRAGPTGPKTLCNACGVRYKSGRLFPEYRPAASPTFVAAVHSNSHKKVVEMRSKASMV